MVHRECAMKAESDGAFWLRWVAANALGEAVGLSAVLLVGFGVLGRAVEGLPGAWPLVAWACCPAH